MIGGVTFLKPIIQVKSELKWKEQRQTIAACHLLTHTGYLIGKQRQMCSQTLSGISSMGAGDHLSLASA